MQAEKIMALTRQVQWGEVTMVLDNEEFQKGYALGRVHYFHSTSLDKVDGTLNLPVSALLRVVALPTDDGHYELDEDEDDDSIEQVLGVLVGYLSGPLHPETPAEERAWQGEPVSEK
jgi:hypothetical protein